MKECLRSSLLQNLNEILFGQLPLEDAEMTGCLNDECQFMGEPIVAHAVLFFDPNERGPLPGK